MPCGCCKTVNAICFWGPMPEKRWKRPTLLVLALLGAGGYSAILALAWQRPSGVMFVVLAAVLVVLSLVGVAVALRGCDACVARLFGSL